MTLPILFADRFEAGRGLAARLEPWRGRDDVVVLGMARGGVPVALEIASSLGVPLRAFVARKLGVPGLEEAAMGAIVEGSDMIVSDATAQYLGVPAAIMERVARRERAELERRVSRYRGGRALPDVRGRHVLLVDDGIASGATLRAAARSLRVRGARSITAAVPVGDPAGCDAVRRDVDALVTLSAPADFDLVSSSYGDFSAVTDREVLYALGATEPSAIDDGTSEPAGSEVAIASLRGDLEPADDGAPPKGLVILAHGGGSSRNSYRNRFLAGWLRLIGWSTLRVDLLTEEEQAIDDDGSQRFDVPRIGERLIMAIDWAREQGVPGSERIMLLGASTGAAAAVVAAAQRPDAVAGVISRGGRVDLAGDALGALRAPLCMIVGTQDPLTLRGNRDVLVGHRGDVELHLVRGAGHTFEESGALGGVGRHMERWLTRQEGQGRDSWRRSR